MVNFHNIFYVLKIYKVLRLLREKDNEIKTLSIKSTIVFLKIAPIKGYLNGIIVCST